MNLRTRSGSKQFHGRAYYFFRDEALNANTFTNNQNNIPIARDHRHDFGGNVGGPIYLPHFGEGVIFVRTEHHLYAFGR